MFLPEVIMKFQVNIDICNRALHVIYIQIIRKSEKFDKSRFQWKRGAFS